MTKLSQNKVLSNVPTVIAPVISVSGPILTGILCNNISASFPAALGALLISSATTDTRTAGDHARSLFNLLALILAAGLIANLATDQNENAHTDLIITILTGLAAIAGGYSYAFAHAVGYFIPFLILATALSENTPNTIWGLVFFFTGAVWAAITVHLQASSLRALGGWKYGQYRERRHSSACFHQKCKRWQASLTTLDGWQYALRITPPLACAGVIRALWPHHHFIWIAITIVLLCKRQLQKSKARTLHRAVGTLIGIVISGLVFSEDMSVLALGIIIVILAGLCGSLRSHNYLVYTAFMTPLVMIFLSTAPPIAIQLLEDRMLATLIGAALVTLSDSLISLLINNRPPRRS